MLGLCLLVACGFEHVRFVGKEKGGRGELMKKYSQAPSEVRISREGLLAVDDNLHVLLL